MLRFGKLRIFRRFRCEAGAAAQQVGRSPTVSARPRDHKRNRLRAFQREADGLAAVEFALVLPVMITMFFGMSELSLALFARTDVTQIASTVADLVAQENAPTSTDLTNVYNAAYTIIYPFQNKPTIRITSIIYNATSSDPTLIGKVAWTCTSTGGTGALPTPNPTVNGSYTLPSPLKPPTGVTVQPMLVSGGSVLMVEVAYTYASPTTQIVLGTYNLQDKFYAKPRRVGQIPAPGCP